MINRNKKYLCVGWVEQAEARNPTRRGTALGNVGQPNLQMIKKIWFRHLIGHDIIYAEHC